MAKKKEEVKETKKKTKAKPKKKEVTPETKVKVYNNRSHRVSFTLAGGKRVILARAGQYTEVRVEDLEVILGNANSLLTKGSLYIDDKDVREFLGIEQMYKDGIVCERTELEKLLKQSGDKLEKLVGSLSNVMLDELFDIAYAQLSGLTISQVGIIERATGRKLLLD